MRYGKLWMMLVAVSACVAARTPAGSPAASRSVEMVKIPGGTFLMGSSTAEPGREEDEAQRSVKVSGFLLMKTEVTQGLFEQVMGYNPAATGAPTYGTTCEAYGGVSLVSPLYPVMCVSWLEAAAFANALSQRDGLAPAYAISGDAVTWNEGAAGYRLPTEAEWEYAARGGTSTPWGGPTSAPEGVCKLGNVRDEETKAAFGFTSGPACSDGAAALADVGSYPANGYGVHDMVGNVEEWAWDWHGDDPAAPAGPATGTNRLVRGGGWEDTHTDSRLANRAWGPPSHRYSILGFRLASSIP